MGKVTGFMDFPRIAEENIPPAERVKNYKEFVLHLSDEAAKTQGARCMIAAYLFVITDALLITLFLIGTT